SADSGYALGRRLAARPEVTAVFASNDQMALGVLRALHEAGRHVPDDVSVVGYDDIPEAAHMLPPLTTVRTDFAATGRRSLQLLLSRIDGSAKPRIDHIEPVRLVVRRSTGPASRGR
ncbi:substrate-binding domain-containing protein, partial [Streptomyces mirabilis]